MVQTGSKSVKNRESSGNSRRAEGAVRSSVQTLVTVPAVVKPSVNMFLQSCFRCHFSYELRFGCSSARWNREDEPHTTVVFILDL